MQGSAKVSAGGPVRTRSSMAKAGSIASLEELEVVGKANAKKQMEWASGRYAARCRHSASALHTAVSHFVCPFLRGPFQC